MPATTIDRRAFDEVILQLQPSLMHLALGLTRDASEARDLVQDALERALREWTRFTPGTNARAWVSAILSRLFIDRWRRRKRQPRFVDVDRTDLPAPGGGGTNRWALPFDGDGPPPRPWEAVTDHDLAAAVEALPAKLRLVFDLSASEHLTYLEISRAAGIPVNTVGTRLLRARRCLRAALEDRMAARAAQTPGTEGAEPAASGTFVPAPRAEWAPAVQPILRAASSLAGLGRAPGQSARRSMRARASEVHGVVPSPASRPM